VVGSLCTLLVLLQLARGLELAEFGRLTFYLAVMAVMGSVADLGTGQTVVQQSSSGVADLASLLRTGRQVRGVTALACTAAWALWCFVAGEPEPMWLVAAAISTFTYTLELTIVPARNAMRLRAPVLIRAATSLGTLAIVSLVLGFGVRGVGPLLFAMTASTSLGHGALHLMLRQHLPPRANKGVPLGPYLWLTLPLGLGALCQQLYFWIDNAFIRQQLGEQALGLYNLPVRLFSFAILVAVLAPQAALPWLARAHAQGRMGPALARVGFPLIALGIVSAGFFWMAAPDLLLAFGPEFPQAASVLRILVVALVCVHAGALWITGMIAAGKTQAMLGLAASGLAINVVGNAILLPRLGLEGAAVATALTEAWVAGYALVCLVRMGVRPVGALSPKAVAWLVGACFLGMGLGQIARPLLRAAADLR